MPRSFNRSVPELDRQSVDQGAWPTVCRSSLKLLAFTFLAGLLLPGCNTIRPYADRAVEERKAMNDSQAELAVLGMCDVAIGAAVRVWSREELELAFLVCNPQRQEVSMSRLVAPGAM